MINQYNYGIKVKILLTGLFVSFQILADSTLTNGLQLHYPFAADGDGASDASGSGHNGVLHGTTWVNEGYPAGARHLGSSSYIDAGSAVNFASWEQYTISTWFRHDTSSGAATGYGDKIFCKSAMYSDQALSTLPGCGWLTFRAFTGGGPYPVSGTSLDYEKDLRDNVWHHVTFVRNGAHAELWVDGVIRDTSEAAVTISNNTQPIYLGYSPSSDSFQRRYWPGEIDEFRIYNRALSGSEVLQLAGSAPVNVITVQTDRASISIPEGGSTNFQVKLSGQPTGDVVVVVARASGDTDISVSGGSSLTFSTDTWDTYQLVTLSAAEDDGDNQNGSATIICSAVGVTNAMIQAAEIDNDFNLAEGLQLYYPFAADGDGASDASGNGHNGALHGTTWVNEGNPAGSRHLGSGSYIDAGSAVNFASWEHYTISTWFRHDASAGAATGYGDKIFCKSAMYSDQALSTLPGCGWLTFRAFTGGGPYPVSGISLDYEKDLRDNVWHHVAFVRNGAHAELWVDGVIRDTSEAAVTISNNTQPIYLGYSPSSDSYQRRNWPGEVDEFRIYNRALSGSEVLQLAGSAPVNVITVQTDRASISIPEGSSTNFQVKLSGQPTGDVVVVVARSSGDADIYVSGDSSLTFSTNNWDTYQSVTVSAAEDDEDNSNGTAIITCSSASGHTSATVESAEIDNDFTLKITAQNGAVARNPATSFYNQWTMVELTARQNAGYHFTGWSGDATGSTNPVTVTMSTNKSVMASFELNDIVILADVSSVSVPEGGSTNFQVKLSAQPTGDTVVVVIRASGDTNIAVSGGTSLIFSTNTWDAYQTVTLMAEEDDEDNQNGSATIICSAVGATQAFVTVTEADDDHTLALTAQNGTVLKDPNTPYHDRGSVVSLAAVQNSGYHFLAWSEDATGTNNPLSVTMEADKSVTANFGMNVITVLTDRAFISVPECGVTNFQVKLNAQPTGDTVVAVAWAFGDPDIIPTVGTNLTFGTNTWDAWQTVVLTAGEDNNDNSNGTTIINCSGADITNALVTATEIDDDFTLTITAVNGTIGKDPDQPFYNKGTSVALTATPDDGYHFTGWSGAAAGLANPTSVSITNTTSVAAHFLLNVITVLTDRASIAIPEGGTTNFQVKLSAQPTGDTTVVVANTAGDKDTTVSEGANLTFSTANWSVYQTVFLSTGEDDTDNVNGSATITCNGTGLIGITVEATEIDDDYTLNINVVNGSVAKDPDSPLYDHGTDVALIATPNSGYHFKGWSGDVSGSTNPATVTMNADMSVTANFALNVITILTDRASVSVPEGYSAEFQVKLNAQPTGDTVVAVSHTAGDEDLLVSEGASLTFTPANWAEYQTVTLAAAEDNDDNQDGPATITCSADGVSNASVPAIESDDDYILTISSLYGTVTQIPDTPYYDNGTIVILTAVPGSAYYWTGYTGDLVDTNNPASVTMDGDKNVSANYCATAPDVLPPSKLAKQSFVARWKWVEGGAPEGEISVILDAEGFPEYVPGYRNQYINNVSECLVTNLLTGRDYWYRVRRMMPDGTRSVWSTDMKVRTGKGMPVFKYLLSDVPVSKGITQEFAISNMVSGVGSLKVKSSNPEAVKPILTADTLTLQYFFKATNTARVTLTLTHPSTGYKTAYGVTLSRSGGNVVVVGQSGLTKSGTRVVQYITVENRTGDTIYGLRVRAFGLDQESWLINRTGLDPVSKAPIMEIPCVLPAGSQMVVRLIYDVKYKTQAKTRPVAYGTWAVVTPIHSAMPVAGESGSVQQDLYDGLWLLNVPANRNRLYTVYHSDDEGATWTLNVPMIRATGNYLMWLDTDEEAPVQRLYRVVDAGM